MRNFSQSTQAATLNNSLVYSTQNSFHKEISILNKYRTIQPNSNLYIKRQKIDNKYLPQIICSLLNINQQQNLHQKVECKCHCVKTEDNYCQLIIKWVQQEYFWKTDRQFYKIYENYTNKKNSEEIQKAVADKLREKLQILGLEVPPQEFLALIQIICNFRKHAIYYNKYQELIAQSDIYIWVSLGIYYHIGFQGPKEAQKKVIAFWALDIIMEQFQSLTLCTLRQQHEKCMKRFQHYYSKWIMLLNSKGVNIGAITWEWINEMMFGYMGIESIGFFLDCFRKSKWDFLFRIILSYFQYRTNQIKKKQAFLNGTIQREELCKLILNGKEEWPLIFCTASSFAFKQ